MPLSVKLPCPGVTRRTALRSPDFPPAHALRASARQARHLFGVDLTGSTSMALAMLGISVPNFVLGPILVLIFSLSLYWLPPSRWGGFPSRNLILPVLTLSAIYMAYIARLTRAGMLEVLRSDYIRTARAKGLSNRQVLFTHVLKNGLIPVVTVLGLQLGVLLAGTACSASSRTRSPAS